MCQAWTTSELHASFSHCLCSECSRMRIGSALQSRAPAVQSLLQTIVDLPNLQNFRAEAAAVGTLLHVDCSLSSCTSLTSLSMNKCLVPPPTRDSLCTLTQLKSLDLSTTVVQFDWPGTNFRKGVLKAYSGLADLTQLTSLDISNFVVLPDSLLQLRSLSSLQTLRLGTVSAGALSGAEGLPITRLRIDIPGNDRGEAAAWLQQASQLQCLELYKEQQYCSTAVLQY